ELKSTKERVNDSAWRRRWRRGPDFGGLGLAVRPVAAVGPRNRLGTPAARIEYLYAVLVNDKASAGDVYKVHSRRVLRVWANALIPLAIHDKIGRAACRERVSILTVGET